MFARLPLTSFIRKSGCFGRSALRQFHATRTCWGLDSIAYSDDGGPDSKVVVDESDFSSMMSDVGVKLPDFTLTSDGRVLDMRKSERETATSSGGDDDTYCFAWWPKHHMLHKWMEKLWHEKGCPIPGEVNTSNPGSFNLVPLELTLSDLDRLEEAVLGGLFNEEDAEYDYGKVHLEDDLAFIEKAREQISKHANKVYYNSWW